MHSRFTLTAQGKYAVLPLLVAFIMVMPLVWGEIGPLLAVFAVLFAAALLAVITFLAESFHRVLTWLAKAYLALSDRKREAD